MTSVITGDIINSRKIGKAALWLKPLKELLGEMGKSPKTWEIYRGDSFQIEIARPEEALLSALRIKAGLRSVKKLDVRMGIGIGDKTHDAPRVSESNGTAFIHSGEAFEQVSRSKQRLLIKTPWTALDSELNLLLRLASIALDKWSSSTAQLIAASIVNRNLSQKELGEKIGRTQSTISEGQKRAHYEEILELENFYRECILKKLT